MQARSVFERRDKIYAVLCMSMSKNRRKKPKSSQNVKTKPPKIILTSNKTGNNNFVNSTLNSKLSVCLYPKIVKKGQK